MSHKYDRRFEAMCNPSDKISNKQHIILKYYFDNQLQKLQEKLHEEMDNINSKQEVLRLSEDNKMPKEEIYFLHKTHCG